MHRFGTPRRFADGARVLETGKPSPGIFVVLSGAIRITGRDGHGHELPVDRARARLRSPASSASSRAGRRSSTASRSASRDAPDRCRAAARAAHRRGRARRADHARADPAPRGADRVAAPAARCSSAPPHRRTSRGCATSSAATAFRTAARPGDRQRCAGVHRALRARAGAAAARGLSRRLGAAQPDRERARALHRHARTQAPSDAVYDVVIVGAGPGRARHRGVRRVRRSAVLVLDARAFGGQAGASARIENYLGFPTGISGQALAGRAYRAGAEIRRAHADSRRRCGGSTASRSGEPCALELGDGRRCAAARS